MSAEISKADSYVGEVIVDTKSDKTLKKNMDSKDDAIRKRTSLVIVPHQQTQLDNDNSNNTLKSEITNNVNTNEKITDFSQSTAQSAATVDQDNPKKSSAKQDRHSIISDESSASRSSHSSGTESISTNFSISLGDDVIEDYVDLQMDKQIGIDVDDLSRSSSCRVNYTLHEKLNNYVNDSMDKNAISSSEDNGKRSSGVIHDEILLLTDRQPKSLPPYSEALLSPQEVPLGRRYAEVAQIKRSSDPCQTQIPFKSLAANSTATTTTTAAANTNVNSNNKINRHIPFCGIDSIKRSDHGVIKGGGQTNLSFDLDAPNDGNDTAASAAESDQFHSLDANESSCCETDGLFENDMQALLPKCSSFSREDFRQSHTSLVSSSDGGILAEGETSSETSRGSEDCPSCDLGLVERLLLTHPVWFLQGIQRSGAVHFLQGKEEGNFIVRGSSQPNTMAVSVRLPPDTGPYIEHYLIQSNEGILSLESSRFKFDSIPALIAHYAQCCDELPVQLILPRALREARNRQQLSSLALLGQEFWRYPMSCPKAVPADADTNLLLLDAKSPNSLTETSGLGATIFSDSAATSNSVQPAAKLFSPCAGAAAGGIFSQAGTPSDTTSSMSSFTTSGCGQNMQLLSPASVDSVILTMSPVDVNCPRGGIALGLGSGNDLSVGQPNNLSTFKSNCSAVNQLVSKNNFDSGGGGGVRPQRPKPPNTLNLDVRKPPAPPMRWSKPLSPSQSFAPESGSAGCAANNFTVTTTVTFSVDKSSQQFVEVATPTTGAHAAHSTGNGSTFQTFAKRLSPEGECKDTLSSQSSAGSRWHSHSSKDSNNSQRKILSPGSTAGVTEKSRKHKARKESNHYQDTDILESPQIYCRSALGDKISDYEDLWSQDPSDRTGLLTSFKPSPEGLPPGRRPDLLAETQPASAFSSSLASFAAAATNATACPTHISTAPPTDPNCADTHQLIQFSGEVPPRSRAALLLPALMSQSVSEDQLKSGAPDAAEGDGTPTPQTPATRSKQGSPFYAEPADALHQAAVANASILRRVQRPSPPAMHRHSEPPKGGGAMARSVMCQRLQPPDAEQFAGSLDELKKKQLEQLQQQQQQQPQQQQQLQQPQQPTKRARGPFEQWQLDSSWEFMGQHDNDTESQYDDHLDRQQQQELVLPPSTSQENEANAEMKPKPITVHQIIAKRLPDLNLPELVRCSTPQHHHQLQQQQQQQPPLQQPPPHQTTPKQLNELNGSQKSVESQNSCRLSSYDNVERNQAYFNGIDSAQSDDGTVFSEPWDSSQWDSSFMPHDDTTINSETIHLSKCRPLISEDDTIIEEFSGKESNQDTLKVRRAGHRQKLATILRNPSMRDREILCHPRNKVSPYGAGPGQSLRTYTLLLAQDASSTFARNIENFIACTKESREAAPQVVMRNMRQFMNGMKNYLVKHGEGKFHQEVEAARARLKSDEFLNLDAILETVMHQLIVLPLREHLYGMFVDYYTRSEDIQLLAQNVKYACARSAPEFGIRALVTPPSTTSLHAISNLLLRLQEAELPLDKLEIFLCVISTIFETTGCPRGQQLVADDFLPVLVYVVAKCGFVGAEIEAEFMWGLLQQPLLNGEPGYYLTSLCSAVQVLKRFMASEKESGTASLDWRSSSLPACSSVLRVIIPDECNGSLQTRTLPVRPHTTTREVCRIIAHKARITNPQDYALFQLVDGEEALLNDTECPQDAKLAAKGKHCMLAYKRIDAKIAWPTTATQSVFYN